MTLRRSGRLSNERGVISPNARPTVKPCAFRYLDRYFLKKPNNRKQSSRDPASVWCKWFVIS